RRRHTRFSRDWSSDVCSSDLAIADPLAVEPDRALVDEPERLGRARREARPLQHVRDPELAAVDHELLEDEIIRNRTVSMHLVERSEERRVGKECRWRRSSWSC